MRYFPVILLCLLTLSRTYGQTDLRQPFLDCKVKGSITLYDYNKQQWLYSDSADALKATQPASTFKVINLLIALETGVIKDENQVVPWVGLTDTVLYGYRPDIYHDMTVKEAFQVSAGWVFIELAKKVGRKRYRTYLKRCHYGNGDLSEKGADFWNFGNFGISPRNQVEFLVKVFDNKLPFSQRNINILKRVMITEDTDGHVIRSKTGWTRVDGNDIGWWVGYEVKGTETIFFATRIIKRRSEPNSDFGACRKKITLEVLHQLGY